MLQKICLNKSHVYFQPIQSGGKYKYMSPVPCYYCPAHCASRKALQFHVKEAHSVVKPHSSKDDEDGNGSSNFTSTEISNKDKKHIYSCRSCEKKFYLQAEFQHHQQFEHFECDNCYKYFSMVILYTLYF